MPPNAKARGIALFQTLLIAALLALIGLGFSQRTQDHTRQAQALEDRTRAAFLAHSALQDGLFYLVTNGAPPEGFNRFGMPIAVTAENTLWVQDLSGLLPIIYPEHPLWARFLEGYGLGTAAQETFLETLGDFQDGDRRRGIESGPEPLTLPSGRPYANTLAQRPSLLADLTDDPKLERALRRFAQLQGSAFFNPYWAPQDLLLMLYGDSVGSMLLSLRETGALDEITLQQYAGSQLDPEALSPTTVPSGRYRMRAEAFQGDARAGRALVIEITPAATRPHIVFEQRAF